jgi:N-acyl homoserine lactone hydrolase
VSDVRRLIPILTGRHRYDASLSLHGRPPGTTIEAPILAYLIETVHGRVLYDVGCDYRKIADPRLNALHFGAGGFPFGPPTMQAHERLPALLAQRGIAPRDIDAVVLGHLHFDHAGGLGDFVGAEIHCHADEWEAAKQNADGAYFAGDLEGAHRWRLDRQEKSLCAGLRIIDSPGHTAGHRSLLVQSPARSASPVSSSVILAGDAADLQENLDREIAPGILWRDREGRVREDLALASIRRLKELATAEGAELWPNHDLAHWRRLRRRGWETIHADSDDDKSG